MLEFYMASAKTTRVGDRFGKLVVTSLERKISGKISRAYAHCKCDCGGETFSDISHLGKRTFGCGCVGQANRNISNTRHGQIGTRTYRIWSAMRDRCFNPNNPAYKNYKDRFPPKEWDSYAVFLADMGECPQGFSLERKDNDKGYGPENCEWIPFPEQGRNKRNNVYFKLNGELTYMSEACRNSGVKITTAYARLAAGKTLAQALGVSESSVELIATRTTIFEPLIEGDML